MENLFGDSSDEEIQKKQNKKNKKNNQENGKYQEYKKKKMQENENSNGEAQQFPREKKFSKKRKNRQQQMELMKKNPQYHKKALRNDGYATILEEQQQNGTENDEKVPYYLVGMINEKKEYLGDTNLNEFIEKQYEGYDASQIKPEDIKYYPKENDEGNVEYKIQLISLSKERIIHLGTQMRYRLREGNGEAYYMIGVEDNGTPEGLTLQEMKFSLRSLCQIAGQLKANLSMFPMVNGFQGKIQQVMVKQNIKETIRIDTRILMLGGSSCGKSTLLGVLLTGERDNGRGLARSRILTHQHEVLSGVTQSISHHFLVFNSQGEVINRTIFMRQGFFCEDTQNVFENLFDMSSKILTFIDVGGHKKAEKQLMTCLCSHHPDYCLLVVSAVRGITEEVEQRIKYANLFNLPFFIVITHIDECQDDENLDKLEQTIEDIRSIFLKIHSQKIPVVVKNEQDVELLARTFVKEVPIPVFLVSNLNQEKYFYNYSLLEKFLNLIPVTEFKNQGNQPVIFLVQDVLVKDGNVILDNGIVKQGTVKKGQMLYLGPDKNGNFQSIEVIDVYCKGIEVKTAQTRQMCSIKIKQNNVGIQIQASQIRKGMVCVEYHYNNTNTQPPKGSYRFEAELLLVDESKEIVLKPGYQPVINTTTSRQACIIEIPGSQQKKDCIVTNFKQQHKKMSKSLDNRITSDIIKTQKLIDYNKSMFPVKKRKKFSMQDDKYEFKKAPDMNRKKADTCAMNNKNSQEQQQQKNEEEKSGHQNHFQQDNYNNNSTTVNDKLKKLQIHSQSPEHKTLTLSDGKKIEDCINNNNNNNSNSDKKQEENNNNNNDSQEKQLNKGAIKIIKYKEIDMEDERIIKFLPNKKNKLSLRFKYNPVYIQPNEQIMISDNTLKAIGWIKKIYN